MKYSVLINEEQRNLLLQATLTMAEDKEFGERLLAGSTFQQLVYAPTVKEDGKHFTEGEE